MLKYLPNGGKIIIIDDIFEEIFPLIQIFDRAGLPVMYFNGNSDDLPEKPIKGVRLVFLDLRINTNIDGKNIISNACNILKRIIGENTEPYLLLIWSANNTEYKTSLEEFLKDKTFKPEHLMFISKDDYFEENNRFFSIIDDIMNELSEYNVKEAENIVKKIKEKYYGDLSNIKKDFREDKIDHLIEQINNGMKESGLLPYFIEWENVARNSASEVINNIYNLMPNLENSDSKLPDLVYFLSKNRLEEQFNIYNNEEKLKESLLEINELYDYFLRLNTEKIDLSIFKDIEIIKQRNFALPEAKLNFWKIVCFNHQKDSPGNIYEDDKLEFDFYSWLPEVSRLKNENKEKLKQEFSFKYIMVNVNGECETAQSKYHVIKTVPGLMIPIDSYEKMKKEKLIKSNPGDFIFKDFESIEYEGIIYNIFFNISQLSYREKSKLSASKVMFGLKNKYYSLLRKSIVSNYNKIGNDLY